MGHKTSVRVRGAINAFLWTFDPSLTVSIIREMDYSSNCKLAPTQKGVRITEVQLCLEEETHKDGEDFCGCTRTTKFTSVPITVGRMYREQSGAEGTQSRSSLINSTISFSTSSSSNSWEGEGNENKHTPHEVCSVLLAGTLKWKSYGVSIKKQTRKVKWNPPKLPMHSEC